MESSARERARDDERPALGGRVAGVAGAGGEGPPRLTLVRADPDGLGDEAVGENAVGGEAVGGEAVGGEAVGEEAVRDEVGDDEVGDEEVGEEGVGDAGVGDEEVDDEGVGDVATLYRAIAGRVEAAVRADVRAGDEVIQEACQFAWARLVHHRHRVVRETALSWLVKTAVHEAYKLLRHQARTVSLEATGEERDGGVDGRFSSAVGRTPEVLAERREMLARIGTLPLRQQRMVWLQALGYSYDEIAEREGATVRSVERQLLRAKTRLRAA